MTASNLADSIESEARAIADAMRVYAQAESSYDLVHSVALNPKRLGDGLAQFH
jgi:hypothetical protein